MATIIEKLNDISKATQGLGVDQSKLDTINSNATTVDQGKMDQIKNGSAQYLGDAYTGPSTINAQYAGPTAGSYNVAYGGPTTTGSFSGQTAANQTTALGANQAVQDRVGQAQGGQAGVASLLRDAYSKPGYTAGENNLDSFLAGGTEGGKAALGQVSGLGLRANDDYANINQALSNQMQDAKYKAALTNNTYDDAIKSAQDQSNKTQSAYDAAIKEASTPTKIQSVTAGYNPELVLAQKEPSKIVGGSGDNVLGMPMSTFGQGLNIFNGLFDGTVSGHGYAPLAGTGNAINMAYNGTGPNPGQSPNKGDSLPVKNGSVASKANSTLNKIVSPVTKPLTQKVLDPTVKKISSGLKSLRFAHGGEIPSYSKLLEILKEKKK